MQLAITIKRDEDIDEIKPLIEAARKVLAEENVTVLEAPRDFNYAYPFPVVTVSEGPEQGRHFGSDAIELLRNISAG
jgi:hypothetical protein